MRYQIIDQFLSAEECDELIATAKTRLRSSTTLNPLTGLAQENDFRKSNQMYFRLGEDQLISRIEKRIADITHTPVENGEGLQVVYYEPGGYFKAHWDDFDDYFDGNKEALNRGGQRIITFLIYLNDIQEGAETYFQCIDMAVKPKTGRALMWWNRREDGTRDGSTYHEGRPVPEGAVKWIATKWIRAEKFR